MQRHKLYIHSLFCQMHLIFLLLFVCICVCKIKIMACILQVYFLRGDSQSIIVANLFGKKALKQKWNMNFLSSKVIE